jgi:hypothetical protein
VIPSSRYRIENGEPCVDVKLSSIDQMFDNRDPAPFRERDLDPDLAEYLLDAGEDLFGAKRLRVVFWVEKPCEREEVEDAVHAHFEAVIDRSRRTRRRRRRTGQVALALALLLVVGLISLARGVGHWIPGGLGAGLGEGLVISGWVVMWRPVEILIYDWIPMHHDRKVAAKLLAAPIDVRGGKGPTTGAALAADERPSRPR